MDKRIWDALMKEIGNPFGVAGVMGNLCAESVMNPRNLEAVAESRLEMTGNAYTCEVDEGRHDFVHDNAGYGLAQWTYHTRKAALLAFARDRGVSIGDCDMQVAFLLEELRTVYTGVWIVLQNAGTIELASDAFMLGYEKPKDTSETARAKRAAYAERYYHQFAEVSTMANYDKYINSTGTHYISNSGHDENNAYHGGAAGDQTGQEWQLKSWYSRPWTVVLRHPLPTVRRKLAEMAIDAALNNAIGYDQYQRNTYWRQLEKCGYDPANVKEKCEADCTAGVTANVKAVGHLLDIGVLESIPLDTYSRNMRQRFVSAGFMALTANKYLNSPDYLLPGDILLYENHHAATNVTRGKKATDTTTMTTTIGDTTTTTTSTTAKQYTLGERTLKNGSAGTDVKELQYILISLGYSCGSYGADGDFGDCTEMAVRRFQARNALVVDGCVGALTVAALKSKQTADAINPQYVHVVGGNCYIRDTGSTSGKIVGVAQEDSIWDYAGETNDNGWHKIIYNTNHIGWVSGKYGRLEA